MRSSQTQDSRYRSTRTDAWFFSFLLGVGVSWDKLRASDKPTSFFYMEIMKKKREHYSKDFTDNLVEPQLFNMKHLKDLHMTYDIRQQIEEEVKTKYLKRINYLVGANNELMRELKLCEKEKEGCISVPNAAADSIILEEDF